MRPKSSERGQIVELRDDQSPSPEAPPRCKRGGRKRDARRGSPARGAMEKGRDVKVFEGNKV